LLEQVMVRLLSAAVITAFIPDCGYFITSNCKSQELFWRGTAAGGEPLRRRAFSMTSAENGNLQTALLLLPYIMLKREQLLRGTRRLARPLEGSAMTARKKSSA